MKRMTLNVIGSLVNPAAAVKTLNSADADRDRPAATDLVGQCAEEYRAEHHSEQRRTRHEARRRGVDAHVLHDGRQRDACDGEVVAVDDDDQHTPQQNHGVEAVELGLVGQFVNVDAMHGDP